MNLFHNCISLRLEGGRIPMRLAGKMGHVANPLPSGWIGFSHQGNELIWPRHHDAVGVDFPDWEVPVVNSGELGGIVVAHLLHDGLCGMGLQVAFLEHDPLSVVVTRPHAVSFSLRVLKAWDQHFPIMIGVAGDLAGAEAFRAIGDAANLLEKLVVDNGWGTKGVLDPVLVPPPASVFGPFKHPNLYFRPGGIAARADKQAGLEAFGPYSTEAFRADFDGIQLVALVPKSMKFAMDHFLGDFQKGMPAARDGAFVPYPQGWAGTYKISAVSMKVLGVDDLSVEGYRNAYRSAKLGEGSFHGLILVIPDSAPSDLYARLKVEFLCLQVPNQVIRERTVKLVGLDRSLALRNLGLNLYAKLGGKPWLLGLMQFSSHEFVVGIGSSQDFGGGFGFATFFSKDGAFRLGDGSVKLSKDHWVGDFVGLLTRQMERLADLDNWQVGDNVLVTFHVSEDVPFDLLPDLKKGLLAALGGRFACEFSFLRLSYGDGFRLGDLSMPGRRDRVGEYAADRGLLVLVNREFGLLQLRRPDSSPCLPLTLRLHPCSDISDLEGLALQVFEFASLSWASMDLGELPATLEYGNLITRQLFLFDSIGAGDRLASFLDEQNDKPWFL